MHAVKNDTQVYYLEYLTCWLFLNFSENIEQMTIRRRDILSEIKPAMEQPSTSPGAIFSL